MKNRFEIANAIVEAFHEEQAKSQQATVRRVTETLNEQLATLKQQVAAAEQRVADLNSKISRARSLIN